MNPFAQKLTQFADDEVLFNAVKSLLFAQCDMNNLKNTGNTAEVYETARAWLQAREFIDQGFREIEKFRTRSKSDTDTTNPNGV